MNKFSCLRCDKEFNLKFDLIRHLNRKIICKSKTKEKDINVNILINNLKVVKITNFQCDICKAYFARADTLKNHKNNRKNPCILNSKLQQPLNNLQTQIINNNTNTSNNTTNNITNQQINNNNLIIVNTDNQPLDINSIHEILKKSNIKDKYIDLLHLTSIDTPHYFVLDVIEEINDLLKILYADYDNKVGHIFALDNNKTDTIYVKKNINQIDELDDATLMYIIYETFKALIKEYGNIIDNKLKLYYKKFINKYENCEFIDVTETNIKIFISEIRNKLSDNLLDLYDNLQKNKIKAYKNAKKQQSEFVEYLKKKKEDYIKSNVKPITYSFIIDELNDILNRLNSYKIIKIFNDYTIKKSDYYVLALFEYYLNKMYFNKEIPTYKIVRDKFYELKDNEWIRISGNSLINSELIKIINILKENNIIYENDNFIEHYDDYDYDELKFNIEDEFTGGENMIIFVFQFLFRYKKFSEYIKPEKNIMTPLKKNYM